MTDKETQGEDLIADFFEDQSIEFDRYVKIDNLKEDDKFFREADFYLPKYKVYVEFLGQWNDPYHKQRYKQKMAVYYKNKKPCIYFWPDNLGTLNWMFKRRMRETLLKYHRTFDLIRYELENYIEEYGTSMAILGFLIYFIKNTGWRIGLSILLIWSLYYSISKYIKRLNKLKKSKWVSGTTEN